MIDLGVINDTYLRETLKELVRDINSHRAAKLSLVAAPNASDLTTVITLSNEIKTRLNELIEAINSVKDI